MIFLYLVCWVIGMALGVYMVDHIYRLFEYKWKGPDPWNEQEKYLK